MERQIRATKREIEATKSIGGDAQDLQNKLRGQMADYKSFSKAAGLKSVITDLDWLLERVISSKLLHISVKINL